MKDFKMYQSASQKRKSSIVLTENLDEHIYNLQNSENESSEDLSDEEIR